MRGFSPELADDKKLRACNTITKLANATTRTNGDCCGLIRLRMKYGNLLYNHLFSIIVGPG